MYVAFYDVTGCRIASDKDAIASGGIIEYLDISAGLIATISIRNNKNIRNSTRDRDVISFYKKPINDSAFVDGKVAIAFIVDEFGVSNVAIAVIFMHEAFAIIDRVVFRRAPIPMNFEIIPVYSPTPSPHFNCPIVIR